jgi:uncharacterized protein (DUF697 family)
LFFIAVKPDGRPWHFMEMEFDMTNEVAVADRHSEASRIVSSALGWSAAAGFVPVPILDVAALAAVQAKMVMDLSALYGEKSSNELARGVVSVLLGTLAPFKLTEIALVSGAKAIPVVGTIMGALSMAGFGTAATYAIGKVFVRHFERGGTVGSLDAESVKEDLKAEFAKAAEKA